MNGLQINIDVNSFQLMSKEEDFSVQTDTVRIQR